MDIVNHRHHFVLVHGLGMGAWCWYKLRTLLESFGHQVTALDLAASGVNLKKLSEVDTMLEYSEPLIEFMKTISNEERVVLVGHSLGGLNIAYAMDMFPEKVSVAVFLTAYMPDTLHRPSYVLDKYMEWLESFGGTFVDSQVSVEGSPGKTKTTMLFGPELMATEFYESSPAEDFWLGTMLTRVGSLFQEDLSTAANFLEERYGSVNRAFIVCKDDKALNEKFQLWMINNNPVKEVKEIKGSDHLAMISKPKEVFHALVEIADKFI